MDDERAFISQRTCLCRQAGLSVGIMTTKNSSHPKRFSRRDPMDIRWIYDKKNISISPYTPAACAELKSADKNG
jgi:hypothetical protein